MGLSRHLGDQSRQFNSTYDIVLDLSGWDTTTIQVVAPMQGAIIASATNDSGAVLGVTDGNASLAVNFSTVQLTNLATNGSAAEIYGAGLYQWQVSAQFLRLHGSPAGSPTNVYRLIIDNYKTH